MAKQIVDNNLRDAYEAEVEVQPDGSVRQVVKVAETAAITGSVEVSNFPATQAVSASALPLPEGAATADKQDEEISLLGQIYGVLNYTVMEPLWLIQVAVATIPDFLSRIWQALLYPGWLDRSANRLRQTAVLESGTVTTVTGLTNIDTYQGRQLGQALNQSAWADCVRARIS